MRPVTAKASVIREVREQLSQSACQFYWPDASIFQERPLLCRQRPRHRRLIGRAPDHQSSAEATPTAPGKRGPESDRSRRQNVGQNKRECVCDRVIALCMNKTTAADVATVPCRLLVAAVMLVGHDAGRGQ